MNDYSAKGGSYGDKIAHLTQVESQVASILIRKGVLSRINCSNLEKGLLQRAYRVRERQL